jgi:transketolase C-terminal domain/subunit
MKYYLISEEVLRATLSYLMQRPYHEVAETIAILTQLPEIPVTEPAQNIENTEQ